MHNEALLQFLIVGVDDDKCFVNKMNTCSIERVYSFASCLLAFNEINIQMELDESSRGSVLKIFFQPTTL